MDLFAIICTTCKSRLRVREEGAIGQILACPNCGGMVMVKPPPNWSAGTQAKLDEPTITEVMAAGPKGDQPLGASAFEAVEDLLSDAPPRMHTPPSPSGPPAAPQTPLPPSALPPSAVPAAPPPKPAAASPKAVTPAAHASPTPAATTAPATPPKPRFVGGPPASAPAATKPKLPAPTPATSDSAAALAPPPPAEAAAPVAAASAPSQSRYWMLMAGSVATGIVLAFAAVSGAMYFLREDATKPIANASKTKVIGVSPTPVSAAGPGATAKVAATPETTAPIETTTPAPPAVTPMPEPPANPGENPPAPMPMPGNPPDPIGIVQPPPPPAAPPKLGDPLGKFDKLIGGADQPPAEGAAPAAAPVVLPPPSSTPTRPTLPRPPPREVDIPKRLADPLLGIQTAGTPLADFLDRISDLTNIPITLEPDPLAVFQKSAESPVVLTAQNTTVGGALAQALSPLGLEYVVVEGGLVVRVAEPAALRTIEYPAKDLAANEEEMHELADLLKALVEPGSWGDAPQQGAITLNLTKQPALSIRQRWAVHAPLIFFCEKVRVARGKPPVSTRFDAALFKADSRSKLAQAKLQTPISLNFGQPTRLIAILDRLGDSAGVRILVDWRDVAAAGWNPDADATLVANKQPLGEALDALLGPLDLTWRIVDGRTLQVVTPARLAERLDVELYPAADLAPDAGAAAALPARVRDALGAGSFRDAGGSGELRLDPASKSLLAALPQPKQRELEALLARWRSEAPAP